MQYFPKDWRLQIVEQQTVGQDPNQILPEYKLYMLLLIRFAFGNVQPVLNAHNYGFVSKEFNVWTKKGILCC
jgi:hypothetical protein